MARVKGALHTRKRHKRILKLAKWYRGAKSKQFRTAKQAVMKSGVYSYTGRKLKKRDFRRLWIARINAATIAHGLSYSKFIYGIKLAEVNVNRKMLAEMAVNDATSFEALVTTAKAKLQ